MSLTVHVFIRDADGKNRSLGDSCAAGFESWRTEVWASQAVRAIDTHSSPEAIRETISQRLANIEDAARRALEAGGGVII